MLSVVTKAPATMAEVWLGAATEEKRAINCMYGICTTKNITLMLFFHSYEKKKTHIS